MERKTHYRVLRSTIVLAKSSNALTRVQTPELLEAIADVQTRNYQFDQIDPAILETIYAHFDEDFTDEVRNEYTFYPSPSNVRVHPAAVAICELCGKGDSKETGDNKDHLRIEYKLDNHAGGQDVWCGSTCIVNFGLNVDGAATAEEAERLLSKSMRQALRQFEIAAWRAENPDHADMAEHYQRLRHEAVSASTIAREHFGELLLMGRDAERLLNLDALVRPMRTASRFYIREGYLTPKKMAAWDATREALDTVRKIRKALNGARDLPDPDARFEYFLKQQEQDNGEAAA
jgi:hypothetical protein